MTQPFTQAITDAMPTDDEMVIGTVTTVNPLAVSARGGVINNVGRLRSSVFAAGDPVALLRQDSTWLALGAVASAGSSGLVITGIFKSAANAILGLTATEQDVPGTSISFTTSGAASTVVALWFADYEVLAAATAVGTTMLRVDGVTAAAPAAIFEDVATGNRGTMGQADFRVVGPGPHTAVLRANRVGGADGQLRLNPQHTTLLLVVLQ